MALNITSGKMQRAQKVCIYGCEGVGKTTLAAQCPDPLFIDTEGGTSHMDVRRIEPPKKWADLLSAVNEVAQSRDVCQSLVIDTVDWVEPMAVAHICAVNKRNGLEDFGYGKGYTFLSEEFTKLTNALDGVVNAGINVILLAHAQMRKFEQPDEAGAYDRWELKLSKRVAPMIKEWCDALLFCNYQTFVVQGKSLMEKAKAQGGKRVIYTTHKPCWDAKNRHGLGDMLPMEYASIAPIFGAQPTPAPSPAMTPREKLAQLIANNANGITTDDIVAVVEARGRQPIGTRFEEYSDDFVGGWIIKHWERIVEQICANKA